MDGCDSLAQAGGEAGRRLPSNEASRDPIDALEAAGGLSPARRRPSQDFGPVVEFLLLGLRVEAERFADGLVGGDIDELASSRREMRRLVERLSQLVASPGPTD